MILLISCSGSRYSGLTFHSLDTIPIIQHPFVKTTASYKFKSEINIYNNYLTGLLVVKQDSNDTVRAILLTEMGVKIFDLSINSESWIINYTIEPINREDLFELIASDMRLLFIDNIKNKNIYVALNSDNNTEIIKVQDTNNNLYYLIDSKTRLIQSIELVRKNNADIICTFSYDEQMVVDSVRITHHDANINLNLIPLVDE